MDKGLEVGADDYIAKPFQPEALAARLNAIKRRSSDDEADSRLFIG